MDNRRPPEVTGPLAPYAVGFGEMLIERGYAPGSARNQLLVLAHVSRWLAGEELEAADLTEETVRRFLAARCEAGYRSRLSPKGMAQILSYLRSVGAAPRIVIPVPASPLDALMQRYGCYLASERGLMPQSVTQYVRVARAFMVDRIGDEDTSLSTLSAGEVARYVLSACRGASCARAIRTTFRLRSLLRFLFIEGLTDMALADVVPVAANRAAALPKAISASDVARLLGSCDPQSAAGRRDLAVLTVLARLGLRAGEVAALKLTDIDWRAGELTIHGKGGRVAKLPLPVDVGEAIVAWLQGGRTEVACPYVFTSLRAPVAGLSTAGVSVIVARACQRAGLPAMHAHRLRHTAATGILQGGGGLAEVAQILRHQSQATSSIYARVDYLALSVLAQPWPGGAQ
jgi:integrase/recombinase XerD